MHRAIEHLTTRTGFRFAVRPVSSNDQEMFKEFFTHVTQDDLRFRFLTALDKVGEERITAMTLVDHTYAESFVAFAEGQANMIATGMLACDQALETGEVAIVIREDYKGRGVSWELLAHIAHYADLKGIRSIQSIESRDNHAAIELEREMGFTATELPDDPTLMLLNRKSMKLA